uniref:Uncharacterized protein n=1 Tax=Echeneis naucrates TaxID=173247 RepID=A0A665WX36_ECHNA
MCVCLTCITLCWYFPVRNTRGPESWSCIFILRRRDRPTEKRINHWKPSLILLSCAHLICPIIKLLLSGRGFHTWGPSSPHLIGPLWKLLSCSHLQRYIHMYALMDTHTQACTHTCTRV